MTGVIEDGVVLTREVLLERFAFIELDEDFVVDERCIGQLATRCESDDEATIGCEPDLSQWWVFIRDDHARIESPRTAGDLRAIAKLLRIPIEKSKDSPWAVRGT